MRYDSIRFCTDDVLDTPSPILIWLNTDILETVNLFTLIRLKVNEVCNVWDLMDILNSSTKLQNQH